MLCLPLQLTPHLLSVWHMRVDKLMVVVVVVVVKVVVVFEYSGCTHSLSPRTQAITSIVYNSIIHVYTSFYMCVLLIHTDGTISFSQLELPNDVPPRFMHTMAAFCLTSGQLEVTMFGGCP